MKLRLLSLPFVLMLPGPILRAEGLREVGTFRGSEFRLKGVALSPDGSTLAIGRSDTRGGELKLWDVRTGKEVRTLTGLSTRFPLGTLAFSPDRAGTPCSVRDVRALRSRRVSQRASCWSGWSVSR
jgi:WD40 repeat protein